MNKLIKLTTTHKTEYWVSTSHIVAMYTSYNYNNNIKNSYTVVRLVNSFIEVEETVEQIMFMID